MVSLPSFVNQFRHHLAEGFPGQIGPFVQAEITEFVQFLHDVAPADVAQRAPVHRIRLRDVVDVDVGQRVTVGIGLEIAQARHPRQEVRGEQAGVGHIDGAPVLPVAGVVAPRQRHAPGTPGEFVAQGIVVGVGRRQPAAVGAEGFDLAAGPVHLVDDAFGRHMIDARIQAQLVEQDDARLPGRGVQGAHRVADVTGREQVRAVLDTLLGDLDVVDVGQQADGDIGLGHEIVQLISVLGDVERESLPARVVADQVLGLAEGTAGDRHVKIILFQQVAYQGPGDQARPKNQYVLHWI